MFDKSENFKLREMLAHLYAAPHALYSDDGELQDNNVNPCIDFKRDSVDEIKTKMQQRIMNRVNNLKTNE